MEQKKGIITILVVAGVASAIAAFLMKNNGQRDVSVSGEIGLSIGFIMSAIVVAIYLKKD